MKEFLIGFVAGLIMLAFWVPAVFTALDLWYLIGEYYDNFAKFGCTLKGIE